VSTYIGGQATVAGTVFPVTTTVSLFLPGSADVTGSFCTGTFLGIIPTDAAGAFGGSSPPGLISTDPGEICVSGDNGKAASMLTNPDDGGGDDDTGDPPPEISITLATWVAGTASLAGSVFPPDSIVSVYAPGTADVTGSFCTGTFLGTLPTDAAGVFSATSPPNAIPVDPGEYCVSGDNGKAASMFTNQ